MHLVIFIPFGIYMFLFHKLKSRHPLIGIYSDFESVIGIQIRTPIMSGVLKF